MSVIFATDEKFALFFGETQSGKSSMINALFNENVASCGAGYGSSKTHKAKVYSKTITKNKTNDIMEDVTLHIVDTPGILDNRYMFTDKEILQTILFALSAKNVKQIDVIFITESLASNSIQFTRNIPKINELFGESVANSIVVLGTKYNLSTRLYKGDVRIDSVKQICQRIGVKFLMYDSVKSQRYNDQFKLFMNMILNGDIVPYKMDEVDKIKQKIEENAQRLMAKAPKYDIVQVPHQVIKYKEVTRQEQYMDRRWGEIGRGGRRYGLFGPRKRIEGWIPVSRTRTVTEMKPFETTEMREQKIQIPKDIEMFREIARNQWKSSLKLKIDFK